MVTGLPDALCEARLTALNAGGEESAASLPAIRDFRAPLPLPGQISNLVVTVTETEALYTLPETDFTGTPVVAGFQVPQDAIRIDFRIYPRSAVFGDERIISSANGISEQAHTLMVSLHAQGLRARLKTNGDTITLIGATPVPLSAWTAGSVIYDGTSLQIWAEGQLVAETAKTGSIDDFGYPVWVGGNPPDNYRPFDGLISLTVR